MMLQKGISFRNLITIFIRISNFTASVEATRNSVECLMLLIFSGIKIHSLEKKWRFVY